MRNRTSESKSVSVELTAGMSDTPQPVRLPGKPSEAQNGPGPATPEINAMSVYGR